MSARRRSKFGNRKTEVYGITFDSAKEARRYQELRLLEKAGEIDGLTCQQPFYLRVWRKGSFIEIGTYRADFHYWEGANTTEPREVIEDVKGFRTPLYRWKKKHVEAQYGIEIRET